jgi:ribokinase
VARALSVAVLNAASVVKFVDTQSGLLSRAALEDELESGAATAPSLYSWSI